MADQPQIVPAPQNVPVVDVTDVMRPAPVVVEPDPVAPAPDPVDDAPPAAAPVADTPPAGTPYGAYGAEPAIASEVADAATVAEDVVQHKHINVATLESLVAGAPGVVKETKAAYKTTEFWLALVVIVLTQLQLLHLPGKYGDTIATVAAVASYTVSRGIAKAGTPSVG